MREKTKFSSVEEISLVEFESQVQDEGQFIVVKRWVHFLPRKKFEGGLKTMRYIIYNLYRKGLGMLAMSMAEGG